MNMEMPNRGADRLNGFDYSRPGAYFITLCTKDRHRTLSEIVEVRPVLLAYGKAAIMIM